MSKSVHMQGMFSRELLVNLAIQSEVAKSIHMNNFFNMCINDIVCMHKAHAQ